jgi:hypothetical protein
MKTKTVDLKQRNLRWMTKIETKKYYLIGFVIGRNWEND